MYKKITIPAILLASFLVVSCGGGGGSNAGITFNGNTSQAAVTTENADELSVAATGGAAQSITSDTAGSALKPEKRSQILLDLSSRLSSVFSGANRTANEPIPDICSTGTADATGNESRITVVFTNCVDPYSGAIMDGTAVMQFNSDDSFSITYSNFNVEYMGESHTMNMTVACDSIGNCTISSDYHGPDGRTYRVEGVTVLSRGGNRFSVSATVYDPDYGYITIDADVTYGSCTGGVPISGSIAFTGSGGSSGTVTFNDCDSFTVFDGSTSTTYNWVDILS